MGVEIIQLDEFGLYEVTTIIPGDHVIPIGDILTVDSLNYFFTMNPDTYTAQLVSMGSDPSSATVAAINGIQYPLASNTTSNGDLLLLSYSFSNEETILSIVDRNGNVTESNGYPIGVGNDAAQIEADILEHYIDPERAGLPFFCGEYAAGNYYFNGIYDFSLSMVFTDLSDTPTGVVQGQRTQGAMTCVLPLGNNNFSFFGYQYNDNFLVPAQSIDVAATSTTVEHLSIPFSEFRSRTPAVIRRYNHNGTIYSIFAAESESRQVILYFYNVETGNLGAIHTVGHINPYTLGSVKVDEQNNLLILGTTLVSGRFERMFLNKVSAEELTQMLGN